MSGSDLDAYRSLSAQALALHRRALEQGNPALAAYLVNQLSMWALGFDERVRPEGADAWLREAVELIERALDAGDTSAVKTLLALSELVEYGEIDTRRLFGKAFELVQRKPTGPDRDSAGQLTLLADLLEKEAPRTPSSEEAESAERIAREILALRRQTHPAGAPQVTASLLRLADILELKADRLRRNGNHASAAAVYRE